MFPHHRPSDADGIEDPLPGFVIGGPNGNLEDLGNVRKADLDYPSQKPAKAYLDAVPAFASGEVCINWNAPMVFVFGVLHSNSVKK